MINFTEKLVLFFLLVKPNYERALSATPPLRALPTLKSFSINAKLPEAGSKYIKSDFLFRIKAGP
jgi:hypothetical protein